MTLLQEAIIAKLLNSTNLKVAMGVSPSATGGVYEDQGFTVKDVTYPRVNVGINTDNPMNAQQTGGALAGKQNHKVYIDIHIFDNSTSSKRGGQIDQVIRQELEGADISYPGLKVGYIEMDSVVTKERDTETGIWHYLVRYALIARVTS